jgi:EmrB/QacA subfamily drug resistance transporter
LAEAGRGRDSRPAAAGVETHHGVDRRILTFCGVLGAMFLAALDQTVVGTAMPRIIGDLNGFDRYTWVTTAYLLTSTAMIPIIGKLSEQLGRKRVFLTGILFFLAASALCGQARDMNQLIVFRGIQGLGAGVIMGTAFVIIADLFAPAERGKYTGFMSAVFGVSSIVGPLIGGTLTDNFSWRWVFYVNVPVGAVVIAGLWLTFPSLRKEGAHPRIDYIGAAVIAAGAALLTLGASRAGTQGWNDVPVWLMIGTGLAVMVVLPFYEARVPEAILPPQMFRSRIFLVCVIISFLLGVAMFGSIIYMPLFLQGVTGVKATYSGLLITPLMAGMLTSSIAGGLIVSHTGRYKVQLLVGTGLMTLGMFLFTLFDVNTSEVQVMASMVVFGLGLGTCFPVLTVAAQNAVERRFISPAVSSMQFIRQIGATLGLAVLGSVVTQKLQDETARQLPASKFAFLPPAFRSRLGELENPQALFGGQVDTILKHIQNPAQRAIFLRAVDVITVGLRVALANSIHLAFLVALVLISISVVVALFIHEIPLQQKQDWGPPAASGH